MEYLVSASTEIIVSLLLIFYMILIEQLATPL